MVGESRTPSQIAEVTDTTTYSGKWRLFWIQIHATVAATVTIGDDTTELMSLYVAADTCNMWTFVPAIVCSTSLKITKSSGTCKITTCRAPG